MSYLLNVFKNDQKKMVMVVINICIYIYIYKYLFEFNLSIFHLYMAAPLPHSFTHLSPGVSFLGAMWVSSVVCVCVCVCVSLGRLPCCCRCRRCLSLRPACGRNRSNRRSCRLQWQVRSTRDTHRRTDARTPHCTAEMQTVKMVCGVRRRSQCRYCGGSL